MYFEWPEFRRCCLCLPLRRGILVFAYINVILTILQIVLLMLDGDLSLLPLRNVDSEMPALISIGLCTLEIVFNILLIYGTHTKRPLFVKVYYYFIISMLLSSIILEVLSVVMSSRRSWIVFFMFCLVLNLYLLFLVRSLIAKLEVSDFNKFSNELADFVDGVPVRHDRIYTEIVVPKDINAV